MRDAACFTGSGSSSSSPSSPPSSPLAWNKFRGFLMHRHPRVSQTHTLTPSLLSGGCLVNVSPRCQHTHTHMHTHTHIYIYTHTHTLFVTTFLPLLLSIHLHPLLALLLLSLPPLLSPLLTPLLLLLPLPLLQFLFPHRHNCR